MKILKREEIINNLISKINSACLERKLSVNEFCRQCHIHKSVMDNLKRNTIPSIDIIANIAMYLDVSIDELIGLTKQVRIEFESKK